MLYVCEAAPSCRKGTTNTAVSEINFRNTACAASYLRPITAAPRAQRRRVGDPSTAAATGPPTGGVVEVVEKELLRGLTEYDPRLEEDSKINEERHKESKFSNLCLRRAVCPTTTTHRKEIYSP